MLTKTKYIAKKNGKTQFAFYTESRLLKDFLCKLKNISKRLMSSAKS
jgi:hypothetical protein